MFSLIIWKLAIICYFLSKVGITLFTWENIGFATLFSTVGIFNFLIAFLIKGFEFYFYYHIIKLIFKIW